MEQCIVMRKIRLFIFVLHKIKILYILNPSQLCKIVNQGNLGQPEKFEGDGEQGKFVVAVEIHDKF